ncbi:MAG: hydrogenase maturation nickel metallochaperone HypA [Candidatus Omnitrophota bacterium]|nr:hydrogenase maturation nickel metallochaperone HypA [Candidatus Omnitrophota bacterium]
MHEYHAVEYAVKQAIEKAMANNAFRISRVNLVIGERLGFEESSIRLYFETISENTIAAGAQLHMKWKKAANSSVRGGREFYIDNIEIEKADNC